VFSYYRLIPLTMVSLLVACAASPTVAPITPTEQAPVVMPSVPPELALPRVLPAEMQADLQLNQHLTITRDFSQHELDAVLAINAHEVKMAAVGFGLRLITLRYDGQNINEQRHALLPASVSGERILRDLVLTYWPLSSIQVHLPEGWRLQEEGNTRTLSWQSQLVFRIQYEGFPHWRGKTRLENLQRDYVIEIVSSDS
jgi:hypothetical protein